MSGYQKRVLVGLVIVLLLMAAATYLYLKRGHHELNQETVAIFSNPSGEAPYTDLLGNPISLDQYLGSPLVVVTWASWSPFSAADLNMLAELSNEFQGREVVFMAINRKESKEQAARFLNTLPDISGVVMALDPRDAFYTAVLGYAMPEVVIYNQQGEVIEHYRGVANKSDIKAKVEQLLSAQ